MSINIIKYVFKAAIRDRLIISLFVLIALGISLSVFIGSAAVIEADQFSVVFAAGGLRLVGVIGLTLFVVFYIRRAFDTKDVEYLLSRPISRSSFIISHSLAFSLLALFFGLIISSSIFLMAPYAISMGHITWAVSLMAEFIIMVNIALFFSMVLQSASSGFLAVLAMYILARIMGQLLGILDHGINILGIDVLSGLMQFISLIVPRLDLMAQTNWLIYGVSDEIGLLFITLQVLAYCFFIVSAALVDLVRRQF
jgi:hypothetical protein